MGGAFAAAAGLAGIGVAAAVAAVVGAGSLEYRSLIPISAGSLIAGVLVYWFAVHLPLVLRLDNEKDTEEQLRLARQRFEEVLDALPHAVAIWDADGRVVYRNSQQNRLIAELEQLPGVAGIDWDNLTLVQESRAVLTGRSAGASTEEIERRVLRPGVSWPAEEYRLPGGRWIQRAVTATREGGSVLVNLDISDIKRAQQRLEDSLEAIPNSFEIWGADGERIFLNGRFLEQRPDLRDLVESDLSLEEFSRRAIERRRPDASSDEIEKEIVRPGISLPTQEHRLPDGRWLQRLVRATTEGGTVLVTTDITELKRAREMLEDSLEAIPNGYMLWGADRQLVYSNRRLVQLRPDLQKLVEDGLDMEQFARQAVTSRMPGASDTEIEAKVLLDIEQTVADEFIAPNGRWFRRSLSPLTDGGLAYVLTDITELKDNQAELERQAEELRRSNQDLEQFAYLASHDLQEPLRIVGSYCDLLQRRYGDQLDGEAREFIAYAVDGSRRMRRLIDDLLHYSRVGRDEISREVFSLDGALQSALASLDSVVQESGARIVSASLPEMRGSSALMAQVFQNLIGNAIKFRGSDSPEINIAVSPGDREWTISVADNGIGIDPKFAERVFRIFQRLHTPEQYPGTGLGLALCRRIIARHGGRMWVETKMPPGATISFVVPM